MSERVTAVFDEEFLAALGRLRLALSRARAADAPGGRRAGRRGSGVEFAEHRAYAPGDELRHVDWSAYARTGRLFVKRFEQEDEPRVLIVVDGSASMATGRKLRAAQHVAYAVAHLALEEGARVRVAVARGGELDVSKPVTSPARASDAARFLAHIDARDATDLDASLRKLPPAPPGSRVVFVLSDLLAADDGRQAAAARGVSGDEVCVLHLAAREDRVFGDRPLLMVDSETGERLSVDGPTATRLAAAHAGRTEEAWRSVASRHRVRYVPVDASWSLEEIVLRRLRTAGVVA